jgi:hypothetical protein
MRASIVAVGLLALAPSTFAYTCITVPFDSRHAKVIAVARYIGERSFVVESILRAAGDHPEKLVAPENWRSSPCAPPAPVPGQQYLVALLTGTLQYREYDSSSAERKLIEKLHVVTAPDILSMLDHYSRGDVSRRAAREWLSTAVIEPQRDDSFAGSLLDAAEDLLNRIEVSEACHQDVIRSLRTTKLPATLSAIRAVAPDVDTREAFVREHAGADAAPEQRSAAMTNWDEILGEIGRAFDPLQQELNALPWCDLSKHTW